MANGVVSKDVLKRKNKYCKKTMCMVYIILKETFMKSEKIIYILSSLVLILSLARCSKASDGKSGSGVSNENETISTSSSSGVAASESKKSVAEDSSKYSVEPKYQGTFIAEHGSGSTAEYWRLIIKENTFTNNHRGYNNRSGNFSEEWFDELENYPTMVCTVGNKLFVGESYSTYVETGEFFSSAWLNPIENDRASGEFLDVNTLKMNEWSDRAGLEFKRQ